MGQYYKPINLDSGEWLDSHDFGNGSKLIEHSYIGNSFLGAVMKLLSPGGKWYKKRIVWCGDYFSEKGEEDYYDKVKDKDKIKPRTSISEKDQEKAILVNHTKKQYVIMAKCPNNDSDGWKLNPLSLLTALGNQRGGGDFYGDDEDKVGIWARDVLSVEVKIPKDFEELEVAFKENWEESPGQKKKEENRRKIEENQFYLSKKSDFYNPLFVNHKKNKYKLNDIVFFKDGKEFMGTGRGWFDDRKSPGFINLKLVCKKKIDLSLEYAFILPTKNEHSFREGRCAKLYLPMDKFDFKKTKTYKLRNLDQDVVYHVFEDSSYGISVTKKIREIPRPDRPLKKKISELDNKLKEINKEKSKAENKLKKL